VLPPALGQFAWDWFIYRKWEQYEDKNSTNIVFSYTDSGHGY
jgi:hypothetical protein